MSGKGRRARAKVQGKGAAKALKNKGRPHLSTPRALALSESPPPSQNEICKRIRRRHNGDHPSLECFNGLGERNLAPKSKALGQPTRSFKARVS